MTHLVIENQNSNTEIVSAAIILKLYELALDVELNEGDVSLKGNLLADHAKLTAYEYLTGNLTGTSTKRFPELSINVTGGIYIDFADPEAERVLMANSIGDGIGITLIDLSNVSSVSSWFLGNTDIVSFNELRYTNVHTINGSAFKGCTSLTSIDLSSCTTLSAQAFYGCTSLTNINSDLSLVTTLPHDNVFTNCPITGHIRLTQLTSQSGSPESSFRGTKITSLTLGSVINAALGGTFSGWSTPSSNNLIYLDYSHTNSTKINNSAWSMGNPSLKLIKLPSTITQIGNNIVANCTSLEAIVLPATTPPTYSGESWQTNTPFLKNGNTLPNANLKIYVPKASLNTYKADANWGKYSDILLSIEDDYTDPDYYATTNAWRSS